MSMGNLSARTVYSNARQLKLVSTRCNRSHRDAVKDINSAVQWYQEHFNCKVTYQDETWAFLTFGNIKLALVIPEQHPTHLAFILEDAKKYGPLKTHRDGTRSQYVNDPAGNSVEIMAPYTVSPEGHDK